MNFKIALKYLDDLPFSIWKGEPLFHRHLHAFSNTTYEGNKPAAFFEVFIYSNSKERWTSPTSELHKDYNLETSLKNSLLHVF